MSSKFLLEESNEAIEQLEELNNKLGDLSSNDAKKNTLIPILGIEGQEPVNLLGFNSGIGSTDRLLSPGPFNGTNVTTYPFLFLSTLQITSDSNNDIEAGSGCNELIVVGIGSDWNVLKETVSMNGILGIDTINQFRFVNDIRCTSTGPSNQNIGNIFVSPSGTPLTLGVPDSDIHTVISPGIGNPRVLQYMVPDNFVFNAKQLTLNSDATTNKPLTLNVRVSDFDFGNNKYNNSVPISLILTQGLETFTPIISLPVPPRSIIYVTGSSSQPSFIFANLEGIIYDTNIYKDIFNPL